MNEERSVLYPLQKLGHHGAAFVHHAAGIPRMFSRIDAIQRMRDDPDRSESGLHGSPVRRNVDPESQSAHHHDIGTQAGHFADNPFAYAGPVRRAIARADNREPTSPVQIDIPADIEHMRIVRTLPKPLRVVGRQRIDSPDPLRRIESTSFAARS